MLQFCTFAAILNQKLMQAAMPEAMDQLSSAVQILLAADLPEDVRSRSLASINNSANPARDDLIGMIHLLKANHAALPGALKDLLQQRASGGRKPPVPPANPCTLFRNSHVFHLSST